MVPSSGSIEKQRSMSEWGRMEYLGKTEPRSWADWGQSLSLLLCLPPFCSPYWASWLI